MTSSYDISTAVVVLPAAGGGRIADRGLRLWLGRSDLVQERLGEPLLAPLLRELGLPAPESGLAALRLWGQTGDRPTAWIAGADPIYLEPRLDTLCLYSLEDAIEPLEFRRLIDHLQAMLGGNNACGFAQLGACGYITTEDALATAAVPASAADGQRPDAFLPAGDAAAGHRRLISEVEMALHEHPVNAEREAEGRRPVNSLWLWGGGKAPAPNALRLPPLFADDALLQGYWQSRTGVGAAWPGTIARCLDVSLAGFVAVVPRTNDPALLEFLLGELRTAQIAGRLDRLVLWFRDGLRADVRRAHSRRVWRLRNTLLESGPGRP